MNGPILFVLGTDTGVGKSVLAVTLVRRLQQGGRLGRLVGVAKPFCSGDRDDARALREAVGRPVPLDEINPWHYAVALAPGIAVRAKRRVRRPSWQDAAAHLRGIGAGHAVTVVEGAGGVLSPLTVDGDATDLVQALGAIPLLVCPNRLGAINQSLLAWRALPRDAGLQARLVLMTQGRPDRSAPSNLRFLRERLGAGRVFPFPWLERGERHGLGTLRPETVRAIDRLLNSLQPGLSLTLSCQANE